MLVFLAVEREPVHQWFVVGGTVAQVLRDRGDAVHPFSGEMRAGGAGFGAAAGEGALQCGPEQLLVVGLEVLWFVAVVTASVE